MVFSIFNTVAQIMNHRSYFTSTHSLINTNTFCYFVPALFLQTLMTFQPQPPSSLIKMFKQSFGQPIKKGGTQGGKYLQQLSLKKGEYIHVHMQYYVVANLFKINFYHKPYYSDLHCPMVCPIIRFTSKFCQSLELGFNFSDDVIVFIC